MTRLDRCLALGTTTIEAKTGYGLTSADELKSLEVLASAGSTHPLQIVPTVRSMMAGPVSPAP